MVDKSDQSQAISDFALKKQCSLEIANLCMEASGYNFDIASSIYENSYSKLQKAPYKNPLFYCGKFVKDWDHYHKKNFTNGQCGPTNGPNCKECRKQFNPSLPTTNDENRKVWQGESGRFYCGVFFGKQYNIHDGYCGPNDGMACESCRRLLK